MDNEVENVRVFVRPRPPTETQMLDGAEVVVDIHPREEPGAPQSVTVRPPAAVKVVPALPPMTPRRLSRTAPPRRPGAAAATESSSASGSASAAAAAAAAAGAAGEHEVDCAASRRAADAVPATFTFDKVYDTTSTQREVFEDVEPYVDAAVDGYNATVFCYGPTGSGKTHTMSGPDDDPGILTRALKRVFDRIESQSSSRMFVVQMSYVELYNDAFTDLLDPANQPVARKRALPSYRPPKIEIHEDRSRSVFLSGSDHLRKTVTGLSQTRALLRQGQRARAMGSTLLNAQSSRSHTIMTLHVESRTVDDPDASVHLGKLHLVDLAGSERLARSGATGAQMRETQAINKSLLALADVLGALSSADYNGPVPYRNSKLTRLLQDSLGGNSKTLFFVTMQTTAPNYQDALLALGYGQRAKRIKNITSLNMDMNEESDLQQLTREIEELRVRLRARSEQFAAARDKAGATEAEKRALEQRMRAMSAENAAEQARLQSALDKLTHQHTSHLAQVKYEYSTLQSSIDDYRHQVHQLRVQLQMAKGDGEMLRDELAQRDDHIADLTEQLAELEGQAETHASEASDARARAADLQVALDAIRARSESSVAASEATVAALEERIRAETERADKAQADLAEEQATLAQKSEMIERLKDKLREIRPILEAHEAALAEQDEEPDEQTIAIVGTALRGINEDVSFEVPKEDEDDDDEEEEEEEVVEQPTPARRGRRAAAAAAAKTKKAAPKPKAAKESKARSSSRRRAAASSSSSAAAAAAAAAAAEEAEDEEEEEEVAAPIVVASPVRRRGRKRRTQEVEPEPEPAAEAEAEAGAEAPSMERVLLPEAEEDEAEEEAVVDAEEEAARAAAQVDADIENAGTEAEMEPSPPKRARRGGRAGSSSSSSSSSSAKKAAATETQPLADASNTPPAPRTRRGRKGRAFFNAAANDLAADPGTPTAPIRVRANKAAIQSLIGANSGTAFVMPKMRR